MFERFRDGLVYPERVLQYRNDSFIKVLLYIFTFAVVMSLGISVFVIKFDGFPNVTVDAFKDELLPIEINCEVDNSILVCDNEEHIEFYNDDTFVIHIDSNETVNYADYNSRTFNFIFHKDKLLMSTTGMVFEFELSKLPTEFQSIDFGLIKTDPEAFSENIMAGVGSYLLAQKSVWAPIVIAFEVLTNLLLIFAISLINAWVIKTRFKIIPYKELFRMSVYSSTGLFVLLTINGMLALGYVMIFLFVIITFRQTNALTIAILKVIKRN